MSLSQQLTRLARNVGALTADTNAIFEALRAKGVNVPANAQLSDAADMIDSIVPTSPFIILNNCDNLDANNVCKSIVGPDLKTRDSSYFGYLVDSSIFPGTKSIRRDNSKYTRIEPVSLGENDVITAEYYLSNTRPSSGNIDVYMLGYFCFEIRYNKVRIGAYQAHDFESSYPIEDWTSTYKAMAVNVGYSAMHFAAVIAVIDGLQVKVTAFLNGNLIGNYKASYFENTITQNGSWASPNIEFVSIRKGDFSNNLQSFTVPTEKYHL